jgi:magnesium transporter
VKTSPATKVARRLGRRFVDAHPEEAARVLENVSPGEVARLLGSRPAARAASVLERLTTSVATEVLTKLDELAAARIVSHIDPQRAALMVGAMPEEARDRLLSQLASGVAADLRELLTFPPDSAGALMNPRITMSFRPEQTVRDVVLRLRQIRRRRVNQIYLVDDAGKLEAIIPLQNVILASAKDRLGELPRAQLVAVPVTATREEVVEQIAGSTVTALPVVDYEGRLVGAIRQDVLVTTVTEEASADLLTMVGAAKEERVLSPSTFAVRKRLPWLQVNLLTAFMAASVVGLFEGTIARFTALAILMPVVAGEAGNTGQQALAVTLRGLALREVRARQWLRITIKEAAVGLINGVAVALTASIGVLLWSGSPSLAGVIALAMVLSMVIASAAGASIPLILSALGQDPAQSSSIFLTTITDCCGFFSFLGLATLFSSML